jgi:hypothetical protein
LSVAHALNRAARFFPRHGENWAGVSILHKRWVDFVTVLAHVRTHMPRDPPAAHADLRPAC